MKNKEVPNTENRASVGDEHLAHAAGGNKPVYIYVCNSCGYELQHDVHNLVCRCPICDRPMKPKKAQNTPI